MAIGKTSIVKQAFCYSKAAMFGLDARIALIVIATLGLIVVPIINNIASGTRADVLKNNMKVIDSAIIKYISDTGTYPETIDHLFDTKPTKASQAAKWKGPYLNGQKTDRYIPSLAWSKVNASCGTSNFKHRYCDMYLQYSFSDVKQSMYNKYIETLPVVFYNANTDVMVVQAGKSKIDSNIKGYSYKIRELP